MEHDVGLEGTFRLVQEPVGLRGIVVVGDPGSSKTTLLKRLLVLCVEQGPGSLGLPGDLVPVYLPLRDVKDDTRSLADFLPDQLPPTPTSRCPPTSPGP